MPDDSKPIAKRKSAGLISRVLSGVGNFVFWLMMSLVFSIVIEWVGIAWFWQEEAETHAKGMLEHEKQHLNERLALGADRMTQIIVNYAYDSIEWIHDKWGSVSHLYERIGFESGNASITDLSNINVEEGFQVYFQAVPYVVQVFILRLAILVFSLPAFLLFGLVGMVDGLVERHLRRWGGGRESSHAYNLARKSVFPLFILAAVIYLSLPFSLHPAIVVMPFAILLGIASRITFERLKKYF